MHVFACYTMAQELQRAEKVAVGVTSRPTGSPGVAGQERCTVVDDNYSYRLFTGLDTGKSNYRQHKRAKYSQGYRVGINIKFFGNAGNTEADSRQYCRPACFRRAAKSKEGKNGGLRFCASPSRVSLLDIMEAIERKRSLFFTDLAAHYNRPEINEARRIVLSCFQSAEKNMKNALAEITIDHFIQDHRQKKDQCRTGSENG